MCEALPNPAGEAVVDCDKVPSLPDVSFKINGKVFTLTPEQYILKVGRPPVPSLPYPTLSFRCDLPVCVLCLSGC